jgi:hypothetical protein
VHFVGLQGRKEESKDSSFSEEKEAKRLFSMVARALGLGVSHQPRSAYKSLFASRIQLRNA